MSSEIGQIMIVRGRLPVSSGCCGRGDQLSTDNSRIGFCLIRFFDSGSGGNILSWLKS